VWVKVSHVTPIVSAFYRVFFGGLFLLAAALMRREIRWQGPRQLLLGLICGLLFALDLSFYHYSIHFVGPGLGTILPNFQVFILAACGILFLKERVHLPFLLSIPMALIGLFMIVGIDWRQLGDHYKLGIYCGIAAAFCYAGFLLFLRKLQADQTGLSIFYVLMGVSFITAAYLAVDISRTGDTFKIPDLQSLWALLALGLFSQSVGWILITNALPQVRASLSGLILLLQPALAFVWDVLFFQRPTDWLNWLGVVIALAAIYMGTVKRSRAKRANRPDAPPGSTGS
jgi:drug/metabolite transporter (DMT)-like permease